MKKSLMRRLLSRGIIVTVYRHEEYGIVREVNEMLEYSFKRGAGHYVTTNILRHNSLNALN
jgi:hypothetical protein